MNWIDIIVILVLGIAVWNGWRRGFIMQVCSLAGIAVAIWVAINYGKLVGQWLQLDNQVATPVGFVVVFVVVLIAVAFVARGIRKLFDFTGFGMLDVLLGMVISLAKYLLILSVSLSVFDRLNDSWDLVSRQTIESSKSYRPIIRISEQLLPLWEWIGDQIPRQELKQPQEGSNI